jgi:hypothetical protein
MALIASHPKSYTSEISPAFFVHRNAFFLLRLGSKDKDLRKNIQPKK